MRERKFHHSKISVFIAVLGLAAASMPIIVQPVHHAPQPYKFGYDIKDKHGEQYRKEEGNGGHVVKGSYGFTDDRGVKREVDYVADHAGFRAQVKTNEPGTANQNPAAVAIISEAPYAGGVGLGYGLGGIGGYGVAGGYGLGGIEGYGVAGGYGLGRIGGYGVATPAIGYGLNNGMYGRGYGLGLGGLGYARYGY